MNILHVCPSPTDSIRVWKDVSFKTGRKLTWDTAVSLEEFIESQPENYDLIIFNELNKPMGRLFNDASSLDALRQVQHKTILVCRSVKLRQQGFHVVVESKFLDTVSEFVKQKSRKAKGVKQLW